MLKIFQIIVRQVVKCHERNIQSNELLSHLSFNLLSMKQVFIYHSIFGYKTLTGRKSKPYQNIPNNQKFYDDLKFANI